MSNFSGAVQTLPNIEDNSSIIWGPDTEQITFTIFDRNTEQTTINTMNLSDFDTAEVFTINGFIVISQWLDINTLLYSDDGYVRMFNVTTQNTSDYGSESYPRYPTEVASDYVDISSPEGVISSDLTKLAIFSLPAYFVSESETNLSEIEVHPD